jgi:hypothetical protein
MRDRLVKAAPAVVLAILLGAGPAWAQAPPAASPDWQFDLTPYAWLTAVDGDVGVGGASTSVGADFADIVKDLDFAAMATVEARRGPLILRLDALYMKLSKDGDTPGPGFDRVDVEEEEWIFEPAVGYRLWASPFAALDAWAGARVWVVDSELRFGGGVLAPRTFTGTKAWADPIVGGRLRALLAGRWVAVLQGDIGGFGVASDLTWQAFAGVGYLFSDRWSAQLGYRALGVDYQSGGFLMDAIMHGPVLALGIRF